jgi:hypothetical protein
MQYLAPGDELQLLNGIENKLKGKVKAKYRLLVLLMLDAGCRVTEAVTIRLDQLMVARKILVIRSLKKSKKGNKLREIPMTLRLMDALAEYWTFVKDKSPESYLFPSKAAKTGHASRKVVWRVIKNLTGNGYPHMLRHTFCTKLAAEGTDQYTIKELAGHEKTQTTEIYIHASKDAKNKAISTLHREGFLKTMYRKLFPPERVDIMPSMTGPTGFLVGRKTEIGKLVELSKKRVNILITGAQGTGKTVLLDNFMKSGRVGKVLRIDDMTAIKKTLAGLVFTLFNDDKEKVKDLLYGPEVDLDRIVTKESIKRLCELLIETTAKHEYTIVIDDATRITPMGITVLEKLNTHFHMVIAARHVKIQQVSFLTNFEKIKLEPLKRHEVIELITRASKDFGDRIEDWEAYKSHIYRSTNGNPKFILEMVERFRREPYVSLNLIQRINHTTAVKEIDMSLLVIIFLSSLMILRYVGREVGSDRGAYMLIGGAFLVFALFARNILTIGKRRFV